QGHRAATGAIRALVELQGASARALPDPPASHPKRAVVLRRLRGKSGPLDEIEGAAIIAAYGVRRPAEAVMKTPQEAAGAARSSRPRAPPSPRVAGGQPVGGDRSRGRCRGRSRRGALRPGNGLPIRPATLRGCET